MTLTMRDQTDAFDARTEVLKRISVGRPYFDLRQVDVDDSGLVAALVPINSPSAPETGLMAAAQVARHLAILGSCAVALQRDDDKRHHYLATKAHFLRTANEVDVSRVVAEVGAEGLLRAEAIGSWSDRRNARAFVKLLGIDGQALYVLDVQYTVMAPRMFDRLHPLPDTGVLGDGGVVELGSTPAADRSQQDLPFDVSYSVAGVEVDCGLIPAWMCAGHFPSYPAAPVALVMGQLARASGLAMNHHLDFGELSYQVDEAKVLATRLGRAGQRLVLKASYSKRVGGGHLVLGTAVADGEVIGELALTLSATSTPEAIPFPIGAFA